MHEFYCVNANCVCDAVCACPLGVLFSLWGYVSNFTFMPAGCAHFMISQFSVSVTSYVWSFQKKNHCWIKINDVNCNTLFVRKIARVNTAANNSSIHDRNMTEMFLVNIEKYRYDLRASMDYWLMIAANKIDINQKSDKESTPDETYNFSLMRERKSVRKWYIHFTNNNIFPFMLRKRKGTGEENWHMHDRKKMRVLEEKSSGRRRYGNENKSAIVQTSE